MGRTKVIALFLAMFVCGNILAKKSVKLEFVCTTDVHGAYFGYNYFAGKDQGGGLSRVSSFLKGERKAYGDNLIYFDNGDILQGQPTAYYYNFIDTQSQHLEAAIMKYLGCQAQTFGNHDVEPGHAVYDRWIKQSEHPVIAANIIDKNTGKPYVTPYVIIERQGVKIAVLGMLTPAIPSWLPENIWSGLEFEDILSSCKKWLPLIQKKEKPDLIIGLFHSGVSGNLLNGIEEDATRHVAEQISGFDAIFCGHDHKILCEQVKNAGGKTWILNGANNALKVSRLKIELEKKGKKFSVKNITGDIVEMKDFSEDSDYLNYFASQKAAIDNYVKEKVGEIDHTITCNEILDGPCEFMDLIHELQLKVSDNAVISIAAPLSLNSVMKAGDITMKDMFNLYRFENLLYTMRLTGREIKGLLEMSYDMQIDKSKESFSFNYDSAYGIYYTVSRSKPYGQRVEITTLFDGSKFELDKEYIVAVNSYRGNGGGDLLVKGSGIKREELAKRIINSTDKDLRYYMMQYIRKQGKITPSCKQNWKFVE